MADETPLPSIEESDQPTPDAPDPLHLSEDDVRKWKARVGKGRKRRQQYDGWWDAAVKSYSPAVTEKPEKYQTDVRTNRTFTIVERKSAELFYQRPDLTVAASPLLEQLPNGQSMAASHAAILNEKLGLDGVNIKDLARRCVFDYEMFGAGWSVMGYRAYTRDVTEPVMREDGQPLMDAMGQPVTKTTPVPVKSECFWNHVSPKRIVMPADFNSTKVDDAPFLGWDFEMSLTEARRVFDLDPEFKGSLTNANDEMKFDHGDGVDKTSTTDIVTGTQLWYKTSQFRDDEIHPDHLTELILIDGLDDAAKHEPCALQSFDERGRLTPDSLVGFPLLALVIRTMTDAAFVMSDVAVGLPLVNELDIYREQMVRQREIALTRGYYNTDKLGKDTIDKAVRAPQGGLIGLPGSAFADGIDPIKTMLTPGYHPDNYTANGIIDNDLARTHAVDSMAAGATSGESGLTATEANLRQANVNVRLGWEQSFVADWFIIGATKFSTIIQRFLSVEDAAQIVGQAKAQEWDSMRKIVPTKFAFEMTPDSSLRNDTPLDRKQLQDLYTFLANDPALNRRYLAEKLAVKYHLDPSRALMPVAQVPQPKPAPPSLALSFKGEDLNPMSPQSPIVLDILSKAGVQIDPQAITNAFQLGMMAMQAQAAQAAEGQTQDGQPPHGGKVPAVEGLSKHAADLTGGMQGSGVQSPMLGGGMPQ